MTNPAPYVCRNGHTRTAANTLIDANGNTKCRDCHNAAMARYRNRRQTAPAPRLPFGPLERHIIPSPLDRAGHPAGARTIAKQCGTTIRGAHRWMRCGLTLDEADTAAVRVGCHPCEIWPEWWVLARLADDS
jgi:hypothetical protein